MRVYRRGATWYYKFTVDGHLFRGSTRTSDKDQAERIASRLRLEAIEQNHFPKQTEIALGDALLRYWDEHAQYLPSAYTIGLQIKKLLAIGPTKPLSQISASNISDYVARRRGEKAKRKETLVSPSTINGELRLLRAVLLRAGSHWNARTQAIKWGGLFLTESAERRRYLSAEEQAKLLAVLRPDFRALVEFCLETGVRFSAAQKLKWSDVDYDAGVVSFRHMKSKRRGETHTLPISHAMRVILANERGNHPIYVFTYLCAEDRPAITTGAKRIKGHRYPYSRDGWRRPWVRALEQAGIENFRFHDLRHTTLSRITKVRGLAVAKKQGFHQDVSTTLRYAHVLDDDLLDAMNEVHKRVHTLEHEPANALERKKK